MSLLMYEHRPDRITIMTDTLATEASDLLDGDVVLHTPLAFTTKVAIVPHLDLVIGGTGWQHIISGWKSLVMWTMAAPDIDVLAQVATALLPQFDDPSDILPGWRDEPDFKMTTTIYHFGWSLAENCYVRDIFRSDQGFAHERHLDKAFGVKPCIDGLYYPPPESFTDWSDLAVRVRHEQDTRDDGLGVHIGGQLVWTMMHERMISTGVVGEFSDRADVEQRILTAAS